MIIADLSPSEIGVWFLGAAAVIGVAVGVLHGVYLVKKISGKNGNGHCHLTPDDKQRLWNEVADIHKSVDEAMDKLETYIHNSNHEVRRELGGLGNRLGNLHVEIIRSLERMTVTMENHKRGIPK